MFAVYFVSVVLNFKSVIILLLNAALSILITNVRIKSLSYIMFVVLIGFSISPVGILMKKLLFHDRESQILLFDVCFTWFNAKCLSLSCDMINSGKKIAKSDVPIILSYLFYFPSLFAGPVHLFDSFKRDFRSETRLTVSEHIFALLNLMKIFSYAIVLELLLHVIHSKAIQFYPHLTEQLDGWTFCGIGYSLTCLFYLKYYVLYGFAQAVAAFDCVKLPDPPACVSRTCESRMLWRTFDRGLYQWLSEYFYRPIIGHHGDGSIVKQLLASAVSFACVCLWHRCDHNVMIWCLINFVSVAVEKYCHSLKLNDQIKCMLFAPLFALMIISNIFFLSNYEVGIQFLIRIFTHVPIPFLPTMIVMYAGCRVSFSLKK
jgi:alginate O-acetyltransferase complex protein AlgI